MGLGAITVGILGESGDGKTTSLIVNEDGSLNLNEDKSIKREGYTGLNPKTTLLINADKKRVPFLFEDFSPNIVRTSDLNEIKSVLTKVNKVPSIKSVVIDTVNGIMIDKEMGESRKMTFDKWYDFSKDVYDLIQLCNDMRDDIIVYFMGHITVYTNTDGNESKCLVTNGKKLEKIRLESKLPIVLFTNVTVTGDVIEYQFETKKNRSTGKTPVGMFKDTLIPNSLSLVDKTIRAYYKI